MVTLYQKFKTKQKKNVITNKKNNENKKNFNFFFIF